MPQKRNPVSSLYIHACACAARHQAAALLDAMIADHERSTGPWEIEWIALPEIFCLVAGALNQSKFVAAGLEVDEKRMRANLELTNGLVVSEAVMMGLGPHLGREKAHDLVYDLCREALKQDKPRRPQEARRALRPEELPRPLGRDGRPGPVTFEIIPALTIIA
jgi:3-carboxy-cis,cis-muconate cycloisomerase